MPAVHYKTNRVTEDLNRYINRWLASGITAAQIETALTTASTNLAAVTPAPTRDRTIKDTGPLMNPTQPRNI